MKRLAWWVLAALAALLLALLIMLKQGDCGRSDDDGDADDGMEPACKPGDQACHAYEPTSSTGPDLEHGGAAGR